MIIGPARIYNKRIQLSNRMCQSLLATATSLNHDPTDIEKTLFGGLHLKDSIFNGNVIISIGLEALVDFAKKQG